MTVNDYKTAHPERKFFLTGSNGASIKIVSVAMDGMIPAVYDSKIIRVAARKDGIRNLYIDYAL